MYAVVQQQQKTPKSVGGVCYVKCGCSIKAVPWTTLMSQSLRLSFLTVGVPVKTAPCAELGNMPEAVQ